MTDRIPAYAIAYLRDVNIGDDIIRYLREIDDTLKPFGGECASPTRIRPLAGTSRPTTNASFRCG